VCGSGLDELWATATDIEYGTTAERFSYFLCRDCDCLSIDPLPAERLREIYPPTYYSFAHDGEEEPGLVHRVKQRLDLQSYRRTLERLPTTTPRILDVGGGTGDISATFVRRGGAASATVVDPDEGSIELARSRGLDGFAGTIEEFQTDERFDLILMLNLIEHVADPVAVMAKAASLLERGGLIWLQTPDFRALDARLFRHRNWAGYHCPRHWAIFSEVGLRRAIGRANLEVAELRRTQGGGFWAQSLLGMRRERQMRKGRLPAAGGDPGSLPKPLVSYRAFPPLAALFVAFDMSTRGLREVSQVNVLAWRGPGYTSEVMKPDQDLGYLRP
jgi:SAM-dependent methyltransferase